MNFMNKLLLTLLVIAGFSAVTYAQKLELKSPNGSLKVSIDLTDKINYSIAYNNDGLLEKNHLTLALKNQVLGQNPKLANSKRRTSFLMRYFSLKQVV